MSLSSLATILEKMVDDFHMGRHGSQSGTSASQITADFDLGGPDAAKDYGAGSQILITSGTREGDISQLSTKPKLSTGVAQVDPAFGGVLNAVATTLNGAIADATATTMTATSAANFPATVPYTVLIESERLRVIAGAGTTTWTVVRGVDNTVAVAHSDTTAVTLQDRFIILKRPLRFLGGNGLVDKINEAPRQLAFIKRTLPYTLVPDGDMNAVAVTDWTGTNATIAKVAATFAKPERGISVTDSGSGGGYAIPAVNLFVEPDTSYSLEVLGWGTDADDSGTLQVKDVTNSNAAITLSETVIDRMEPEILRNTFTAPSGCKEIQIRLVADAANDVVTWANLAFRKNETHEFILPDTPVRPMEIGRLGYYQGSSWNTRGEFIPIDVEPEQMSGGLWRYRTDVNLSGVSVWYERFDKPADLTAHAVDVAEMAIPPGDLAAMAAELALRLLRTTSRQWAADYEYAASRSAAIVQDYHQHNQIVFKTATALYPSPVV